MKLKLKALAAAALIAAGASAHAAVQTGSGVANGELVFLAYDPTTLLSYSFDTGIRFESFLPNSASLAPISLSGFSTFKDQVGAANLAGIRWGVYGSDGLAAGGIGLLTTQGGPGTVNPATSRISNINGGIQSFFNIHNTLGTHVGDASVNGWAIYQATSATSDVGYVGRLLGTSNNFNSNLGFNATGGLSDSLSFLRFNNPNPGGSIRTQFGNSLGASSWALNGNNLVFTAPVPEPSTYALMLAGLGAVGFMARRRRNQA